MIQKYHFHKDIIRQYDIRGIIGINLSGNDAFALGSVLGVTTLGHSASGIIANTHAVAIVGRDGRHSSPILEEELCRGLSIAGIYILRIGLCTSPMLAFTTKILNASLGIMITGSHNPSDYNGFKIIYNQKPFYGQQLKKMAQLSANGYYIHQQQNNEKHGGIIDSNALDAYITALKRELCDCKNLKIAWDPGNGAAGHTLHHLLPFINAENYIINGDVDGSFPNHHPDPVKEENLQQLRDMMHKHHCDVGFAFDGDGDRIGVIDNAGHILWGDDILAILAYDILKIKPNATIIADVKTSQRFFDYVNRLGGNAIMSPTGHSIIKTAMIEHDADLAGEMSGHIFFADRYYGIDDGVYAALRLLKIIQTYQQPLSELRKILPISHVTPEIRLPIVEHQKFKTIERIISYIKENYADNASYNFIDGVRYADADGWWLLRASHTEPAIIARCEAYDKDKLSYNINILADILRKNNVDDDMVATLLMHYPQ